MNGAVLAAAVTLGIGYALVGVAVVAVVRATRALHLAVGPVLVLGVVVSLALGVAGWGTWPALLLAMAVCAVVSAALEPLVLRPLRASGDVLLTLVGLAVAGAVIETAAGRWLTAQSVRPDPLIAGAETVRLGAVTLPAGTVAAVALGIPVTVLLAIAVSSTRWGRRLRVVGSAPRAAELGGISPRRVRMTALAVSGAVAAFAGALLAPISSVGVGQGGGLTVRGIAAAILIGFGGPVGAVVAGLALGAVEAVAQGLWPVAGGTVVVAIVVVAVLSVRGGERTRPWERRW